MGWGGMMGAGQAVQKIGENMWEDLRQQRIQEWKSGESELNNQRADERLNKQQLNTATNRTIDRQASLEDKKTDRAHATGLMQSKIAADDARTPTFTQGNDDTGKFQQDQHGNRKYHTGTGSGGGGATARMKEVRDYMANNKGVEYTEAWRIVNTNRNDPFTEYADKAYARHVETAKASFKEPMDFGSFINVAADRYEQTVNRQFGSGKSEPKLGGYSPAQQAVIAQVKAKNPGMSDDDAAEAIQKNVPDRWPQ